VCTPLAISPPTGVPAASCASVWNGSGSQRVPKSTISSAVISQLPSSMRSPGLTSSA
jgi:hypothetical protein